MTLITNWKEVLKKAWSIKFAIAAAVFSGLEAVFMALEGTVPDVPQGLVAGMGATFAAGGIVARVLDQAKVTDVAK